MKKRFLEMKNMNHLSNLNRELKQSLHVLLRESLQIELRFLPQEMLGAQGPHNSIWYRRPITSTRMTTVAKITRQSVHAGVPIFPFDPESNMTQKPCIVLPEGQDVSGEQNLSSSENKSGYLGCNPPIATAAQHNGPQSCVIFFPAGEISTKTLSASN